MNDKKELFSEIINPEKPALIRAVNSQMEAEFICQQVLELLDEDIIKVEEKVNEKINNFIKAEINEMNIDDAKKMGAMALFGEKYGDKVRVVKFGDSIELCGGTHVTNTSDIKRFAIKSIESKGLNIFRIEAVCDTNLETELFSIIKPYNDGIAVSNELTQIDVNFSFIVSAAISTVVSVVIVCPFTLLTIAQMKSPAPTAPAVICAVVETQAPFPKRASPRDMLSV